MSTSGTYTEKSSPLVSVIMPCYQSASTISRAVNSVRRQTLLDLELILIDDGSTDSSYEICESLAQLDSRIKLLRNSVNVGVATSRNKGLKVAKGRYIAFLDADDEWFHDKLARQLRFMKTHGYSVCCGSYDVIGFGGKVVQTITHSHTRILYQDMLYRNLVGNLTGIYDSYYHGKVYQERVGHEDYLMWLELIKSSGHAGYLTYTSARYFENPKGLSSNKWRSIQWHYNVLRLHTKKTIFPIYLTIVRMLYVGNRAFKRLF